ncbi:hypothetical protein SprV_0100309400 [Sparganum proliferum]
MHNGFSSYVGGDRVSIKDASVTQATGGAAMLETRALFGGAFQILLPASFKDVSTFRQVPDNQEVFVNDDNNESLSIDILDSVDATSPEEAARLHFEAIAECNAASSSTIQAVRVHALDSCPSVVLVHGLQKVAKFNQVEEDLVRITFALYRRG